MNDNLNNTADANDTAEKVTREETRTVHETKVATAIGWKRKALYIGGGVVATATLIGGAFLALRKGNTEVIEKAADLADAVAAFAAR